MNSRRRKNKRSKKYHKPHKPQTSRQETRFGKTINLSLNEHYQPQNPSPLYRAQPPKFGEQILHFILPKENRESDTGDLAEHYRKLQPILGAKGAYVWYYKEVSILLVNRFSGIVKMVVYRWFEELLGRYIR